MGPVLVVRFEITTGKAGRVRRQISASGEGVQTNVVPRGGTGRANRRPDTGEASVPAFANGSLDHKVMPSFQRLARLLWEELSC